MEIKRVAITIGQLVEGYINESETDMEKGVYAYGGKLCVRPAFQRMFVYDTKQENAVIDTALKGFPLNIMYWVDNGDGTYDCLDRQQRTISLCRFVDGTTSFSAPWFKDGKRVYCATLKRIDPDAYKAFLDYELEVYICKGIKAEQMEWFQTVNIAGEELYPQELRNANYTSKWLTDAKRYFSKASLATKCPAEQYCDNHKYTNKNANRQEILEQVISWMINSKKDEDICGYMEAHIKEDNADELWEYYKSVINWADSLFGEMYDRDMASVNWGHLYNNYHNEELDADGIAETFKELIDYKANKELTISVAKICEYCITRDETLLKHREFNDAQKTSMYNKQKGICPDCDKHYLKNEMHAHHIIPWYNGGTTEMDNGVMLCEECHRQRHL